MSTLDSTEAHRSRCWSGESKGIPLGRNNFAQSIPLLMLTLGENVNLDWSINNSFQILVTLRRWIFYRQYTLSMGGDGGM